MRFLLDLPNSFLLLGVVLTSAHGPAKPKVADTPQSLRVELLPDTLDEDGDFPLDGMPVPLGGKSRVAYVCHGDNELAKAFVLYRVVPRTEPGTKPAEKPPWIVLPLALVRADDKTGKFNPKTGVFAITKFDEQVPFHAIPSADAQKNQVRILGGGRVLLNTNGLVDSKGKRVQTRPGDQIEYCVEVTVRERKPGEKAAAARSVTRVTSIVTLPEFLEWYRHATDNEEDRIRKLKLRQKDFFKEKQP